MVSPQNPFHDILMFAFLLFVIFFPPFTIYKKNKTEFVSKVQMLYSHLAFFPIRLIVIAIFSTIQVNFKRKQRSYSSALLKIRSASPVQNHPLNS